MPVQIVECTGRRALALLRPTMDLSYTFSGASKVDASLVLRKIKL